MNNYTTKVTAALLALAVTLPSVASAQLSPIERRRAEEVARIQAKADAEERTKERFKIRERARVRCLDVSHRWDSATESCKSK